MRDAIHKLGILTWLLKKAYMEWNEMVRNRDLDGCAVCGNRDCEVCESETTREFYELLKNGY